MCAPEQNCNIHEARADRAKGRHKSTVTVDDLNTPLSVMEPVGETLARSRRTEHHHQSTGSK